jgi:hypothetical protein
MKVKSVSVQLKNKLISSSSNSASPSTISRIDQKNNLAFPRLIPLPFFMHGYPQNELRRNVQRRKTCTYIALNDPPASTHRSALTLMNRPLEFPSVKPVT